MRYQLFCDLEDEPLRRLELDLFISATGTRSEVQIIRKQGSDALTIFRGTL